MDDSEFLSKLADILPLPTGDVENRLNDNGDDMLGAIVELAREFPDSRNAIGNLWANFNQVSYVDLKSTLVQPEIIKMMSREFAQKNTALPLYQFGDVVTVAAATPDDKALANRMELEMNAFVSLVFSFPPDIEDAISIHYQTDETLNRVISETSLSSLYSSRDQITSEQLQLLAGESAVIELTNGIFLLALRDQATDIHIEPGENDIRVRFRIDGVLQERLRLDCKMLNALISRLKIMANADISETRKPQDGRIKFDVLNQAIDMRFSCIPSIYGEKIVLRILGRINDRGIPDLSHLDMSVSNRRGIEQVIDSPNGVFFVTGPTGSGKTTTLYSMLKRLNTPGINIMTIEDPVEYRLDGINQVQVNNAVDLTFSSALRSFLRQDPDVILIGEIRDMASAKIAAQAALTGHLVLATMHTNNSLQAVTRLVEIGVEPFLVAPSIIAVMAQRLVRKICEKCKTAYPAPREFLDNNFEWDGQTKVELYRGTGCEACRNTGYAGRIAIHEVFLISEAVRSLIARNASILDIEQSAAEEGFRPMRYDGLKKAIRGLTSIEEIDRAVPMERVEDND